MQKEELKEGDRVKAFHPNQFGVIQHGTIMGFRQSGAAAVIDFGPLLGGKFVLSCEHITEKVPEPQRGPLHPGHCFWMTDGGELIEFMFVVGQGAEEQDHVQKRTIALGSNAINFGLILAAQDGQWTDVSDLEWAALPLYVTNAAARLWFGSAE